MAKSKKKPNHKKRLTAIASPKRVPTKAAPVAICGSFYSLPPTRAVTCQCSLPRDHTGRHNGVDRNGMKHSWANSRDTRDADTRLRAGETVSLEDLMRDREAKAAKGKTKRKGDGKPSERLARGETVDSQELVQEQTAANMPKTSAPAGEASSTPFSAPSVPDTLNIMKPVVVTVGSRVMVSWGPGAPRRGIVDRFTRDGNPVVRMERVDVKGEPTGELGSEGRTFNKHDIVGVINACKFHGVIPANDTSKLQTRPEPVMTLTPSDAPSDAPVRAVIAGRAPRDLRDPERIDAIRNGTETETELDQRSMMLRAMTSKSINADLLHVIAEPNEPLKIAAQSLPDWSLVGADGPWMATCVTREYRDRIRAALESCGYICTSSESPNTSRFWLDVRARIAPDRTEKNHVGAPTSETKSSASEAKSVLTDAKPTRAPRGSRKTTTVSKVVREPGKSPELVEEDLPPFDRPTFESALKDPVLAADRAAMGKPPLVAPTPALAPELVNPHAIPGAIAMPLVTSNEDPRTFPENDPRLLTAKYGKERQRRALLRIEADEKAAAGVPAHDASRLEDETHRRDEAMQRASENADAIDPSRAVQRGERVVLEEEERGEIGRAFPGDVVYDTEPPVDDDKAPWED